MYAYLIRTNFERFRVVSRLFKWMISICHAKYREPGMCELENLRCSEKREFGKLRTHAINHSELTWYIFLVRCNLFYRLPNVTFQLNFTSNRKFFSSFNHKKFVDKGVLIYGPYQCQTHCQFHSKLKSIWSKSCFSALKISHEHMDEREISRKNEIHFCFLFFEFYSNDLNRCDEDRFSLF